MAFLGNGLAGMQAAQMGQNMGAYQNALMNQAMQTGFSAPYFSTTTLGTATPFVRPMTAEARPQTTVKEKTMFQEITADVKGFVKEHRGIIYFIVVALMVDHFIFRGAFKHRLQAMADKMVLKVEEKIA